MKFEIYYPAKPYVVNQAWGIYNPAYSKFGFDHHNGIDIRIGADGKLTTPVRMRIFRQDYFPEGGGYQVEAITTEKWEVGDQECYVLLTFCHNKQFLHQVGDILEIGDEVAIPDNTGFSTGPHTHFGAYRVDENNQLLDHNDANGSFDQSPYYNGFYAEDSGLVVSILKNMISLYTKVVNLLQK